MMSNHLACRFGSHINTHSDST